MGVEEEAKKVEVEAPSQTVEAEAPPATPPRPPPLAPLEVSPKDVTEEKTVIPSPTTVDKVDDSKAISVVDKVSSEKSSGGSADRDAVLARVQTEKRMSLIKAWEESEKTQSENKAHKKLSTIISWENTKKASVEAQLKAIEEKLEKKKAEYAEKMKNKIAIIHKEAEEKRALVEAKRCEEMLKAEEMAAKYRATGLAPKKLFGCFSG